MESRHRGACAVVDANGALVQGIGDVDRLVFPRSAIKPVQALPLIETGAADHFALSDTELALACASHNGEAVQVAAVQAWLTRMGLSVADLACGIHPSLQPDIALALAANGTPLGRAHNNCSGKHTGFLATALHLDESLVGYEKARHPVQQRIKAVMEDLSGVALGNEACGVDGCGIPACAMPLRALALAMARMAGASDLTASRQAAARRIVQAMANNPLYVAGSGRSDTRIMAACGGRLATKIGAEGVHVAILPERQWGIALKIDDGTTRASDCAMANVLDQLGMLGEAARKDLADLLVKPLINTLGEAVGEIRPAPGLSF